MSRPNPFMSVWPPADANPFDCQPEVRQARKMFRAQLALLRQLAGEAMNAPSDGKTHNVSQEIADLLHNISGTAAYFGKAGFGAFAGAIEQPVRAAFTAQLLHPFCRQILDQSDCEGSD